MSVIHFGSEALGIVAVTIVTSRRFEDVRRICNALEIIARANAACFNARYGENEPAATFDEIWEAGGRRGADLSSALSTVGLLAYNCEEYLAKEEGGQEALITVQTRAIYAAQEALEARLAPVRSPVVAVEASTVRQVTRNGGGEGDGNVF